MIPAEEVAKLRAELTRLRAVIVNAANVCDAWARESQEGGWSTHQVTANRELANDLRWEALRNA